MPPSGKNYRIDPHSRQLSVETLEDRRMLATFTVTNLLDGPVAAADDLPGSLRQAIFDANNLAGADEIDFSGVGGTLLMTDGEFQITDAVTINGPGQEVLTIDADATAANRSRVFAIDDGGITNDFDVSIDRLSLTNGVISLPTVGDGGAIFSQSTGKLSLTQITVSGSQAQDGGAVYSTGPLEIEDSLFFDNFASIGGAIFSMANLDVTGSTIRNNESSSFNGGGINAESDATITESAVIDNDAESRGGGIHIRGELTLVNSTISGNTAYGMIESGDGQGGGIFAHGDATIRHSTITDNYAIRVYNGATIAGNLTVENSIFAGNSAGDFAPDDLDFDTSETIVVDYSIIGTSFGLSIQQLAALNSGTGNQLDIDPLLGPLQNNGGPTFTHALLPGSPAIDMGDPAFATPPVFDQRGEPFTRVHNGRIDIGAYEAQPLLADVDGDQVVTGLDFLQIQVGGGDIARWEAEYGLREPEAPSLVATLAAAEPQAAAFWITLPEKVIASQEEPLQQQAATAPIDRAFADTESANEETTNAPELPAIAVSNIDSHKELTDDDLDEALVAEFG